MGSEVDFTIAFNGATVPVHHIGGDPPELFKPGIPVVLEGHWDQSGQFFTSDTILIKHSADYKEQNPDRVSFERAVDERCSRFRGDHPRLRRVHSVGSSRSSVGLGEAPSEVAGRRPHLRVDGRRSAR